MCRLAERRTWARGPVRAGFEVEIGSVQKTSAFPCVLSGGMSGLESHTEQTAGESSPSDLREWWFRNVRHPFYWRVGQLAGRTNGRGPLLVAMGDSLTDPYVGFTFPRQVWLRCVGREGGYKTVNLGVGGSTTAYMCERIDTFLSAGQPDIAVLAAGNVDAEQGIASAETERNVRFILDWLEEHGVSKIALVGPGMVNLPKLPDYMSQLKDWRSAIDDVRAILRDIAVEHDAVFVDLAQFLCDRIADGKDPDFSLVPYRPSRSWHPVAGDAHLNAYGHRLVAEAFLTATSHWRGTTVPGEVPVRKMIDGRRVNRRDMRKARKPC